MRAGRVRFERRSPKVHLRKLKRASKQPTPHLCDVERGIIPLGPSNEAINEPLIRVKIVPRTAAPPTTSGSKQANDSQMSGVDKANQIVSERGLLYRALSETLGRGNCFFYAIVDQLLNPRILQGISTSAREVAHNHESIRKAVAKFMTESEDLYNNELMATWLDREEVREEEEKPVNERRQRSEIWLNHIAKLNSTGTWADETFIRATAMFFGKDIFVINEDTAYHFYGTMNDYQPVNPPMAMVHMDRSHFQSVHRLEDLPLIQSSPPKLSGQCMGCNWSGKSIRGHLKHTKSNCRDCYDMDALEEEAKRVNREKAYARSNNKSEMMSAYKKKYYKSHSSLIKLHQSEYRKKCKENEKLNEKPKEKKTEKTNEDGQSIKTFSCTKCKKIFSHEKNQKRHMKETHGNRIYRCSLCNASYVREGDIKKHVRREHKEEQKRKENIQKEESNQSYLCNICEKTFSKKQNLNQHIRDTHNEEKRYECPECPDKFSRQSNLKRHVERGKHLFKYACNYCEEVFSFRSTEERVRTMDKHYIIGKSPPSITIEIGGIKRQDMLYQNQCKYNHICCAKCHCVNEINLTDERREEILVKRLQNNSSKEKLLLGWRQQLKELKDEREKSRKALEYEQMIKEYSFFCQYCKTKCKGITEREHYKPNTVCKCPGCRVAGFTHECGTHECEKKDCKDPECRSKMDNIPYHSYWLIDWKENVDSGKWKTDSMTYDKYVTQLKNHVKQCQRSFCLVCGPMRRQLTTITSSSDL